MILTCKLEKSIEHIREALRYSRDQIAAGKQAKQGVRHEGWAFQVSDVRPFAGSELTPPKAGLQGAHGRADERRMICDQTQSAYGVLISTA